MDGRTPTCKHGHHLTEDNLTVGKRRRCKTCRSDTVKRWKKNNPERVRSIKREWRKENRLKEARSRRKCFLKRGYSLSPEKVEALLKTQEGVCANQGCRRKVPGKKRREWCIDHDHKTNKVRGLLCNYCNVALGMVNDNIEVLLGLVEYLRKHEALLSYGSPTPKHPLPPA